MIDVRVKIGVLSRAILLLSNPDTRYSWYDNTSCNAGILAQAVLNTNKEGLALRLNGYRGQQWKELIDTHNDTCSITALPLHTVFQALHKHGFSPKEIINLEQLGDKKILAVTGPLEFESRTDVIQYMRQWVKNLKAKANA